MSARTGVILLQLSTPDAPTQMFLGLARAGRTIAAVCPGFTADCLETIEEINMTGRKSFLSAGGRAFHMVPCLNDAPEWIGALAQIAERELSGWTRS